MLGKEDAQGRPAFVNSNGVDAFGGGVFGAWYAFNAVSLFTTVRGYVVTTGDTAFLDHTAGRHTVREWMRFFAIRWQSFPTPGVEGLADYGGFAGDFLECVSSYVHAVPALQASNAWMMREVALLTSNATRAAQLTALAKHVAAATQDHCYAKGQGFWRSIYPGGRQVDVRTVVDFQAVSKWMLDDVTPTQRSEMADFFMRELNTPGWPIALSRSDPLRPAGVRRPARPRHDGELRELAPSSL